MPVAEGYSNVTAQNWFQFILTAAANYWVSLDSAAQQAWSDAAASAGLSLSGIEFFTQQYVMRQCRPAAMPAEVKLVDPCFQEQPPKEGVEPPEFI